MTVFGHMMDSAEQQYTAILQSFIKSNDEGDLMRAQDFGRALVSSDTPPEEVGGFHDAAMSHIVANTGISNLIEFQERASAVLLEVLMAYGLAYRKQMEHLQTPSNALKASEQRYLQVFERNQVAQIVNDPNNEQNVIAHQTATEHFGYAPSELQNETLDSLSIDPVEHLHKSISSVLSNESALFYFSHLHRAGAIFDAEFHATSIDIRGDALIFAIIQDITERRKAEEQVQYLATHDSLTSLPNRTLFVDRIEMMLAEAERSTTPAALISFNIDDFKSINDALGADAADLVLQKIATRLKAGVRATDTVARLGSDEFGITWGDLRDIDDLSGIVNKITRATDQPIDVNGHPVRITASMGVSIYPYDATTSSALLQHAEQALHTAKAMGGRKCEFFVGDMGAKAEDRRRLEDDLYLAIEREELELHYQGQVDIRTGLLMGAEALVRWNNPDRGYVSPVTFIPVAESNGLIIPIGKWVLEQACRQISEWSTMATPPVVSVNMSPVQMHENDIVEMVKKTMEEYRISPRLLNLELTETAIMRDTEQGGRILDQFRKLGVELALDDFGTGFSSLSYLNRYPFSKLKIDREFINDITPKERAVPLVDATISMGHSLGMSVVAEGVENMQQVQYLKEKGCDIVQGYVFCRPVPAQEFSTAMLNWDKDRINAV